MFPYNLQKLDVLVNSLKKKKQITKSDAMKLCGMSYVSYIKRRAAGDNQIKYSAPKNKCDRALELLKQEGYNVDIFI